MSGWKVAEIGGGYGGLAKILLDVFAVAQYSIYDLPEVVELQKRYSQAVNLTHLIHPRTLDDATPSDSDLDLVISNYAISELQEEAQLRVR